MPGYWINVENNHTGVNVYVTSADDTNLDYKVQVSVTRWSPNHTVKVVPFDSDTPVQVVACTGRLEAH